MLLGIISIHAPREGCDLGGFTTGLECGNFNPRTPRGVRPPANLYFFEPLEFQSTHPARGATGPPVLPDPSRSYFNPRTPRGVRPLQGTGRAPCSAISIHAPREGCDRSGPGWLRRWWNFNPRTPRGVRQQTLPKSREFAWLNLLICTRGRRLSIQKQTRLCSIKLSFMLFGCEPAGEGVSSWTSHATKSKVRLEGRSAYSQSARSSAHSDFPGNKSGDCPVRGP